MNDYFQKKLDNIKWNEFKMSNILRLEKCKCNNASLLNQEKQEIPYVGATNRNNGNMYFVKKESDLISLGGCIVFVQDGEGSMGTSFYKQEDFIGSTTLSVGYNENLNKYNGMFISTISDTVKDKYNFGYKRNLSRLKSEIILLPADNNNNPDWNFMTLFMQEIEKHIKPNSILEKHKIIDYRQLEEIEWERFKVEELFDTKIGKSIDGNKVNKEDGETPYITRKETLNGVDGFINWDDKNYINKVDKPVITIGNETAQPFVQEYDFFTGTKVNILTSKKESVSKYQMLFVAKCLEMNKEKYSYSYTINSRRLKKQKIMLPTNNEGNPDWLFMEQYMKRIENELKSKVVLDKEKVNK